MLDGCASSFHPCHASDQHVYLRKKMKWRQSRLDWTGLVPNKMNILKCHVLDPRRAMLYSCHLGACCGRKLSPRNVSYTRFRYMQLMYISLHTIDVYIDIYNWCIYRALRARSDWVQSTDARISYASAPPLTNCHRSPNSMMFLDSGIKLASHTETILRILEMCFDFSFTQL